MPGLSPRWGWNLFFKRSTHTPGSEPSGRGNPSHALHFTSLHFKDHYAKHIEHTVVPSTCNHVKEDFTFSSSLAGAGGNDAEESETLAPSPRFNRPHSYWSRAQDSLNAELRLQPSYLAEYAKARERREEAQKNDPRFRINGQAFQLNMRPFQAADFELSAETLVKMTVLKAPDSAELQPSSSTSSTSAATDTQQNNAASGCCILPSCTIL